ncbi:glutaminyl-tRNA synthase (glutamine-hydrolyzing) subunit B [Tyzzerella sp. An114]|uniref:Asp-tRNA(Asn)/Glu-tRNA(Gln) amidotransferase subunit GatB n=1 Tax=Tyzzerella sp. An114 TaxID=1965545 RepID=UPI000B45078F|nr:Asp-tRNA(Asn)/Glu-tRNA(Gln) amidotransferase subunit GatB [Tyzzerella sp. An114]OUQ59582.1 glutaminyl-tRNA synthase (glutamine-hydrolyzing) subunit B [Tyzzerella sp. An114]
MEFETVMGLEVHVELSTKTKIFCSCTTEFGGEPNTHVCEVCTGMPGTLPVLNEQVVEYAIRTGLATNCEITQYNKFDRKNYFYPDLPKAYQVSQLYLPICRNGHIDIEVNGVKKSIGIHEIHMEEDAGKLIHDPWDDCTLVDYNRCGVPLLEIVSEPDFRSGEEVIAYLTKLKQILQYIDVSDCKMEQGSMRADVNLSVRPFGQDEYGTRTEMKNINSFKAIARAIEGERARQIELITEGKKVVQETRRWDDNKGSSFAMRSKENAQDYRYFPEPDLVPIEISDEWIERVRASLPELPTEKKERYMKEYKLPEYDVDIITGTKALVKIFEEANAVCNNPKEVSNWIMVEVLRLASETNTDPDDISFDPKNLGVLINLVKNGVVNRNTAKEEVLAKMFSDNVDPEQYIKDNNLQMVSDDSLVRDIVTAVIAANPNSIKQYKEGNEKVVKFLMGQSMKQLKGKANPAVVTKVLEEELAKL